MPNEYYDHGAYPPTGAPGRSADARAEFDAIEVGFDRLAPLTGNAYRIAYVNGGGTRWDTLGGDGLVLLRSNNVPVLATPGVDFIDPNTPATLTNKTIVVANNTIVTQAYGTLAATELNAALAELDDEKVARTLPTGSAVIPAGTTAQRDPAPQNGYMRFNATLQQFEGFYNGVWQSVGGGQLLGNAVTKAIFYNSQAIAENLTVGTGVNGGTFGPVTINDGFAVTVNDGSVWSIV